MAQSYRYRYPARVILTLYGLALGNATGQSEPLSINESHFRRVSGRPEMLSFKSPVTSRASAPCPDACHDQR